MGLGASGENTSRMPRGRSIPDHFDRLAPFVADAFQVRDHLFKRQLVAHPQLERDCR